MSLSLSSNPKSTPDGFGLRESVHGLLSFCFRVRTILDTKFGSHCGLLLFFVCFFFFWGGGSEYILRSMYATYIDIYIYIFIY